MPARGRAALLGMKAGEKKVEDKAAAKAGIYGNDAVEATYPMTRKTADGTPLHGSRHKYTLTFAKGHLRSLGGCS